MKKRILLFILAVLMLLTMVACGKKGIEGTWKYVSGDAGDFSDYGDNFSLTFKGGKMSMKLDMTGLGLSEEEAASYQAMLDMAVMTYKVNSDTELEMTVSFFGESSTETVTYELNGDTLTFEGAVFQRQ